MSGNASGNHNGIGFCGLLAGALIVLKLARVIQWPWLWVLAPLWMPAALAGVLIAGLLTIAVVVKRRKKKEQEELAEAMRPSMKLPFEKDVPLPEQRAGAEETVPELIAMKAGESILIPNLSGKSNPPVMAVSVGLYGIKAGKRFETEYQEDGLRVWRTR